MRPRFPWFALGLFGAELADSGGWELFLSPVFWVTYRQSAFRGGVPVPIADGLKGRQATSDYRARADLVYHF